MLFQSEIPEPNTCNEYDSGKDIIAIWEKDSAYLVKLRINRCKPTMMEIIK
jgi:hypothetical protein